jgi:hypothetical protein
MKLFVTSALIFLSIFATAQNPTSLDKVEPEDTMKSGQSIIYGNFIQRLRSSSFGFPQDIRLINLETEEILTFRVKPIFEGAKQSPFICYIKPGKYAILNYWWTQSKWYGGTVHTEPIFKNIDATDDLEQKLKSGRVKPNQLERFAFAVAESSLNYLGTWHFDTGLVSFTDEKSQLDNLEMYDYKSLDFSKAVLSLPN